MASQYNRSQFTSSDGTPDRWYYNATISNPVSGDTNDVLGRFQEMRTVPLLENCESYFIALARMSVQGATANLPVLIPPVATPTPTGSTFFTADYWVGLRYRFFTNAPNSRGGLVAYSDIAAEPLVFQSEYPTENTSSADSRFYWVSSGQSVVTALNQALARAYAKVSLPVTNAAGGDPYYLGATTPSTTFLEGFPNGPLINSPYTVTFDKDTYKITITGLGERWVTSGISSVVPLVAEVDLLFSDKLLELFPMDTIESVIPSTVAQIQPTSYQAAPATLKTFPVYPCQAPVTYVPSLARDAFIDMLPTSVGAAPAETGYHNDLLMTYTIPAPPDNVLGLIGLSNPFIAFLPGTRYSPVDMAEVITAGFAARPELTTSTCSIDANGFMVFNFPATVTSGPFDMRNNQFDTTLFDAFGFTGLSNLEVSSFPTTLRGSVPVPVSNAPYLPNMVYQPGRYYSSHLAYTWQAMLRSIWTSDSTAKVDMLPDRTLRITNTGSSLFGAGGMPGGLDKLHVGLGWPANDYAGPTTVGLVVNGVGGAVVPAASVPFYTIAFDQTLADSTSGDLVSISQEYDALASWTPFNGMAITSSQIPAYEEAFGINIVPTNNIVQAAGNASQNIIFDVDLTQDTLHQIQSGIAFVPSIFRYAKLRAGPLNGVDMNFYLRTRDGRYVPWIITNGGVINVKLMFTKEPY